MKVGNLDVTAYVTCAGQRCTKVWATSLQPEHRVDIDNPTTVKYQVAIRCQAISISGRPRLEYFVDNTFIQTWDTKRVWIGGLTLRPEANAIARTPTAAGPAEFRCYEVEIKHPSGAPQQYPVLIPISVAAK
jgi:hypothetical protein